MQKQNDSDRVFREAVAAWTDFSDQQWKGFRKLFQVRTVAPRMFLNLPGDQLYELVFVQHGLLRFFYSSADGKETNKAFVAEGEFAAPLASAELNVPLYFGVQALESTSLLVAPLAELKQLYATNIAFERFGRKLAEYLLIRKEVRMRSLLEQTATQRYLAYITQNPNLVERIPQYQLAAYLGITEVSLSRIKATLRPELNK